MIAGQSQVFIADPSAVEKVYRHEGKYPLRSITDVNADWILKRKKILRKEHLYSGNFFDIHVQSWKKYHAASASYKFHSLLQKAPL